MLYGSYALAFLIISVMIVDCKLQSRNFAQSQRSVSLLFMGGGFGAKPMKKEATADKVSQLKQQIISISDKDKCICGSDKLYGSCCGKLHTSDIQEDADPALITRARYTAYALGIGSYVINSCHKTHKDYKRFLDGALDTKKAMKLWNKEIVTQNSEVFEFLKFELIDDAASQRGQSTISDDGTCSRTLAFRMIARQRNSGQILAFQEASTYIRDQRQTTRMLTGAIGELRKATRGGSSTGKNKNKNTPAEETDGVQKEGLRWYYSEGEVSALDEETTKRMAQGISKYSSVATIRDRWEKTPGTSQNTGEEETLQS